MLAENSSGLVPGTHGQTLFAYVRPGEHIEATLTAIAGGYNSEGGPLLPAPGDSGKNYCLSLADAGNSIYCAPGYPDRSSNPTAAKVTITGPGANYSNHFDEEFSSMDPYYRTVTAKSLPADSLGKPPTVWKIQIDTDEPDLFMRFRWEVNVMNGTDRKKGRIWTEKFSISQINSKEHPFGPAGNANDTDLYYSAIKNNLKSIVCR